MKPLTQQDALVARARRLLHDHRTRAKKDGAALDYGLVEVRQLLAEHPVCEYCRAPLSYAASLDHRTPTGRGGRHILANLAVCCTRCNSIKGQLTEAEFRDVLTLLARMHPAGRQDVERRLLSGGKRYAHGRATPLEKIR
jgi:5-methylcytosine-specific restriction endonuclease McrA